MNGIEGERYVLNVREYIEMLEAIVQDLIKSLDDCSTSGDVGFLNMCKAPIPDLQKVFSDIVGEYLYFVSRGPITGEPLVAEWDNGLVHIAKVDDLNYVIYPDGTHSKGIRGSINRIYVNKEGKLAVNINGIEVIVKK